jgi:hypothetical protein
MNFKYQSSGVKSFADVKPTKTPEPCTYSPGNAYVKNKPDYEKSCIKFMPPSKKILNFVDFATKLKQGVPAPGTYQNVEKASKMIYKGASPRHKRGI